MKKETTQQKIDRYNDLIDQHKWKDANILFREIRKLIDDERKEQYQNE